MSVKKLPRRQVPEKLCLFDPVRDSRSTPFTTPMELNRSTQTLISVHISNDWNRLEALSQLSFLGVDCFEALVL